MPRLNRSAASFRIVHALRVPCPCRLRLQRTPSACSVRLVLALLTVLCVIVPPQPGLAQPGDGGGPVGAAEAARNRLRQAIEQRNTQNGERGTGNRPSAADRPAYEVRGSARPGRAATGTSRNGRSAARSRSGSGRKYAPGKTIVSVEILTVKMVTGIQLQPWQDVFQKLGVSVRVRQTLLEDKPEVKEIPLGTLRQVKAVGQLQRDGTLFFPGKVFRASDGPKLKEWIDELKTYGAQGAPEGQPLWGLDEVQFQALYTSLAAKVEPKVHGLSFDEALARLPLNEKYPLRISTASRAWLQQEYETVPPVRQFLRGMSTGTALAVLLNDYGLGFRPLRTPEGAIEIAVDPLKQTTDVWPIGWDLKLSRAETAPTLFQLIPIALDDALLVDVLDAVAVKTEIPILTDHYRIEGSGIDLSRLKVSYPSRKSSWSLLLRAVTNPHKLTRRIRIDEQGQPFVWITTLVPGRPER